MVPRLFAMLHTGQPLTIAHTTIREVRIRRMCIFGGKGFVMKKSHLTYSLRCLKDVELDYCIIDGKNNEIVDKWWSLFSGYGAKASWKTKRMYWHSFSFGCMPSLSQREAVRAYELELMKKEIYLFSSERKIDVIKFFKKIPNELLDKLIKDINRFLDLYIIDTEFHWTFVRTHEESVGIGPFYSRADWKNKSCKLE